MKTKTFTQQITHFAVCVNIYLEEWFATNTTYNFDTSNVATYGDVCIFPFATLDPTNTYYSLHYECQDKPFYGGFGWCGVDAEATLRGGCRGE